MSKEAMVGTTDQGVLQSRPSLRWSLNTKADWSKEERAKPGASMERVKAILPAFLDELLTATRQMELLVK